MKYFYSTILVLILINPTLAQDSCKTNGCELKHGVQFQITDLLNITNFRGYTFSYRYLLNNNAGVRLGITVNYNDQNEDRKVQINNMEYDAPYSSNQFSLKFSTQYLTSILNYNEFALMVGGGPFLLIYNSESKGFSPSTEYIRDSKSTENGFSFGLDFIVGVEYSIARNVILSGESGIYVGMSKVEKERINNIIYEDENLNQINVIKADQDKFSIDDIAVNLGISVFF